MDNSSNPLYTQIDSDFPVGVDGTPMTPDGLVAPVKPGAAPLPLPTVASPPPPNPLVSRSLQQYKAAQKQPASFAPADNAGYSGNVAPGVTVPHNQKFTDSMQDLTQDFEDAHAGAKAVMVSGDRDVAKQAKLYANYVAKQRGEALPYPSEGQGGMAAAPGKSAHNYGVAADVTTLDSSGKYSPAEQAQLNQMAAQPWRGITPGVVFGDADHYQAAGVQPSADAKAGTIAAGGTPPVMTPTVAASGGPSPAPAATSPPAAPTVASSVAAPPNLKGLYTLAMLQHLFPQHQFTPISYNPFAVMPRTQ